MSGHRMKGAVCVTPARGWLAAPLWPECCSRCFVCMDAGRPLLLWMGKPTLGAWSGSHNSQVKETGKGIWRSSLIHSSRLQVREPCPGELLVTGVAVGAPLYCPLGSASCRVTKPNLPQAVTTPSLYDKRPTQPYKALAHCKHSTDRGRK